MSKIIPYLVGIVQRINASLIIGIFFFLEEKKILLKTIWESKKIRHCLLMKSCGRF